MECLHGTLKSNLYTGSSVNIRIQGTDAEPVCGTRLWNVFMECLCVTRTLNIYMEHRYAVRI